MKLYFRSRRISSALHLNVFSSFIIYYSKTCRKKNMQNLQGFSFPRRTLKTQCLSHRPSAQLEMWARHLRLHAILLGQDHDNDHLDLLSYSILSSFDLNFSSVFAGYYFGRMGGHHVLRSGCPLLLQFYIFYIAYYSKYTLIESI